MSARLEHLFGNLRNSRYRITSPDTPFYNCIAWAAGETHRRWWPIGAYWPDDAPNEETVESFIVAFRTLEYEPCEDGRLEKGYQKLAIYVDATGTPTHMARQLDSGAWTSKCGSLEDIEHETLNAVGGHGPDDYGQVVKYLKRPLPGTTTKKGGLLTRIFGFWKSR